MGGVRCEKDIIEGMNHILKDAPLDKDKNYKTYIDPKLPLNEEFRKKLISFIKGN